MLRKIRQGPPGLEFGELLTSGEGGVAPFDPPPSALAVLVEGKKAHGILGGKEPAAPRIDSRKCDLYKAWGEIKSDFPTCSKWQIRLGQWHKLYRGGAARRRGSGSEK